MGYLDPADSLHAEYRLLNEHFTANRMQIGLLETKLLPLKSFIFINFHSEANKIKSSELDDFLHADCRLSDDILDPIKVRIGPLGDELRPFENEG